MCLLRRAKYLALLLWRWSGLGREILLGWTALILRSARLLRAGLKFPLEWSQMRPNLAGLSSLKCSLWRAWSTSSALRASQRTKLVGSFMKLPSRARHCSGWMRSRRLARFIPICLVSVRYKLPWGVWLFLAGYSCTNNAAMPRHTCSKGYL